MRMRLPTILILATTAGCGHGGSTDVEPTLVFADRTDLEISRLVSAAAGTEMFSAQSTVLSFEDPFGDAGPCPSVAISGNTVTITGGCSVTDGPTIQGSATVENPAGWRSGDIEIDYDFSSDQLYTFVQFSVDYGGYATTYDGSLRVGSSYGSYDADLTVTQAMAGALRSDLYFDCDAGGCDLGASGLELVGFGGARVSGSLRIGGQALSGALTLRGVDTVRVTIASNCVTWRLDGTDRVGPVCP